MPNNAEMEERLKVMEVGLQHVNLNLNSLQVGMGYLKEQQAASLVELKTITSALNDTEGSPLGRSLTSHINGCANRLDGLILDQKREHKEEITELRNLVFELKEQSDRVKGALNIIQFLGFSALASGVFSLIYFIVKAQ